MKKFSLELPKYRLAMHFRLIRRRKPLVAEPIIPTARLVNKKYRRGTFVGKAVRHIFGHQKIGKAFGTILSLIVVVSAYFPPNSISLAQENYGEPVIVESEVNLKTIKGIQYPTNEVKITQKYSFFHPGLDLDGLTGDQIKPIKPGKVVSVSRSKYAYGNSIIIDHGNKLTSLYAHLSKIEVEEGQEVTMDTEIGKMGATGRAFGDHLHLEIYDHGKTINPLSVLSR